MFFFHYLQKETSSMRTWRNWKLPIVAGMAATLEKSLTVPQKVKHRVTLWPSNFTPRYIHKRTENICPQKTYIQRLITPSFIIAKKWKQPTCPSTDECINKMWYIHTMEYYSAMKRNAVLIYSTTWMKFENIMLSDREVGCKLWFHLNEMFR